MTSASFEPNDHFDLRVSSQSSIVNGQILMQELHMRDQSISNCWMNHSEHAVFLCQIVFKDIFFKPVIVYAVVWKRTMSTKSTLQPTCIAWEWICQNSQLRSYRPIKLDWFLFAPNAFLVVSVFVLAVTYYVKRSTIIGCLPMNFALRHSWNSINSYAKKKICFQDDFGHGSCMRYWTFREAINWRWKLIIWDLL